MMQKRWILSLLAVLALVFTACAPAAAPAADEGAADADAGAAEADAGDEGMSFEGIEINVATQTGPSIASALQRRGQEFSEMTGAQVNVIEIPFADLYQRVLTDMATGTNSFDAAVFAPQWMVDYVVPGYLEDLTDRVAADEALQWDDVAPFFRDFSSTFEGRVYTIPLDGDFHMLYYRTDVLEELGLEPPTTWDEYLEVAAAAHGTDMNGDGEADYGSCIAKKRGAQTYWFMTTIASAYIQSQGTAQGAFFDLNDMSPLVNNAAFAKALEFYAATSEYGPPDELNQDVTDTRQLFPAGRCALNLDWGDIGPISIDPEQSSVNGLVGAAILPGSTEVFDRETGELVPCDETTCPHAIDGVNHAPFAAFGGWSGGINSAAPDDVKEATYAFLSYVSQPEQSNVDVTIGETGFNPYRSSQFENMDVWVEAGFSEEFAENYLGAIGDSLASPNMVLDLRIPLNQRYQQVVLDTTVSQFLAGELTLEEAMAQIEAGWEEVTEEVGREAQLEAYKATIGAE